MFLDNCLILTKSCLVALSGLLSILEFVLKHISLVGEVIEFIFGAIVALLSSDNRAELLV